MQTGFNNAGELTEAGEEGRFGKVCGDRVRFEGPERMFVGVSLRN